MIATMPAVPPPPPFRAEHFGSLVRPRELIEAREAYDAGRLSLPELLRVEEHAVRNVVWLQETLGFRSITDGEYRRPLRGGLREEFESLAVITRRTPKIALTASAELGRDLSELLAAGCRYVQLAEPPRERLADDRYAAMVNAAIAGCGGEMHVALRLLEEPSAEGLFNRLEVHSHFIAFKAPRPGCFASLRWLPAGKPVVLGLVSSRSAELESAQLLVEQVHEASGHVPLEHLSIATQGGFSLADGAAAMTSEQQNAKLRRVIEVARLVWGET